MAKQSSAKTTQGGKKKIMVQLTGKSMALWLCLLFLVCGWMFVLGVLVGRGTAPVNFDIQAIQKELIALKESMLRKEKNTIELQLEKESAKSNLEFYEALKGKSTADEIELPPKKEAPEKPATEVVKKTPSPPLQVEKKAPPVLPSAKGHLAVQVASTKDSKSADRMVGLLRKKGYSAFSIRAEIPEKGTWYRVRIGYFDSKTAADALRQQLIKDGYEGIVVKR
ncbi:MAG: SPOR domain-containing protein [Deltaproteobacteria bacterium]|jgi:cell division septation protein DedD